MRWLRLLVGPVPELRLIVLLLGVIVYLLFQLLDQADDIEESIPYVDTCGDSSNPCRVVVDPY